MTDLAPITALGGTTPQIDKIGGVTITENADISIASVAVRNGHDLSDMPPPEGYADGTLWAAPGQWLVTGAYDPHFATGIKNRFGSTASVTDQTDAWVVFDVTGNAPAFFERLCNIDIHAMQTGRAIRTVIEHLGCFVIRDGGMYRILGARSSAGSLHHALVATARAIA